MTPPDIASSLARETQTPAEGRTAPPLTGSADAESVARARAGDDDAVAAVYDRYFDRVVAEVSRFTGRDESFALDVAQEVFMKFIRRPPTLEPGASLAPWLRTVARASAVDAVRAETRRARRQRARRDAGDGDDAAAPGARDELADLLARVREMPEPERSLIVSRFARDRTIRQAASDAGLSLGAAQGRLSRALARCAALVQQQEKRDAVDE